MSAQEDSVFTKIILHNNLLSREQLDSCAKEVNKAARKGRELSLSEVVLSKKLLTRRQVYALAWSVQHVMMKSRDSIFAKALFEKRLVAHEDLEKAFLTQRELYRKKHQSVSIHEILVKKGVVAQKEAERVWREIQGSETPGAEEAPPPTSRKARKIRIRSCEVKTETITLHSGRKVSCIRLAGTIDADNFHGLQEIVDEVLAIQGDEGKYLVLDLKKVDYISSAGVGVLLSVNKAVQEKGGACKIAGASGETKTIISMLGLSSVIGSKDMESALKNIAEA